MVWKEEDHPRGKNGLFRNKNGTEKKEKADTHAEGLRISKTEYRLIYAQVMKV